MSSSKSKVLSTEPLDQKDAKWATLVKTTYTDPNGVTRTWESGERLTRPVGSDIDGVGIVAILQDPASPSAQPSILLQKQWRPPVDAIVVEVPAGLIDPKETPEQCAIRELKEETGYVGKLVEGDFGISGIMFNGESIVEFLYERGGPLKSYIFCYRFLSMSKQLFPAHLFTNLRHLPLHIPLLFRYSLYRITLVLCSLSLTLPTKNIIDPGFCNTNLRMVHLTVDLSLPENQNPVPELEENEFIETFSVPLTDLWAKCREFESAGHAIDARVGTLAEGIECAKRWKLV
ncbi:hypothetical protein GQ43DRAFT_438764 [Delitschia confertaspora ATCC 74209]|uniref:Nudix hydrolase domain-containing protein n=1 Tax=Delitschia confertaspora ATCC 74209 TaxID=1513339 RepID=A0A9P4MRX9_9PLEO|nr:hypothetical protein GQ43DRAFT_438764 [Delitschia confertaspora ATCC 74209]